MRHRVPASTTRGGKARAAAQSPVPKKPANARKNGTWQATARKHAVDMDTPRSPKKTRGGCPGGTKGRLLSRGRGSVSPRGGRRGRDASDAVLIVLHATFRGRAGARYGGHRRSGSTVSHRAPPRQGPRIAPPGTKPAGSTVARSPSRHTGSTPSVLIQAAHELAAGKMPAGFLDRVAARTGAHRHRGTGPGHDSPSLIAYYAPRPPRARRVP